MPRLASLVSSDRLFAARQLAQLGLFANAVRPVHLPGTAVPAFFAGWPASELAPHIGTLCALDAGTHLTRRGVRSRTDVLGLVAAAANVGSAAWLATGSRRAGAEIEDALQETLGADYAERIERPALPDDDAARWQSLAMPFRVHNASVAIERNIPYAEGGKRFELDVYYRADLPPDAPVLLQIHGGAWMFGSKDHQGVPLMLHMAARGWVCVAINYPLSPKSRWPAHLVAAKQAMAWIREHGHRYGADPTFVATTGGSAGGHLASLVALTAGDASLQPGFEDADTSVQACVPHYGVYDFTEEGGARSATERLQTVVRPKVMSRDAVYPDDYRAASPLSRIGPDAPPFLVVHGTNDTLVPVAEAREFVAKLRETSRSPVAYAEIAGAQHAFDIFPSLRSAHVVRGVARFLEWCHATRAERPAAPQH
ncbi:alpha/beta hydrolase fold domain-containing protein [uncultured Jatrophihabitans sp.]|uniref:alpha/beta hydrolase fold domain-containing protein n=1 Tax=uncultured Jatrophihabitans sp. TaxID=1610747 RepID=UPI0035CBBE5A